MKKRIINTLLTLIIGIVPISANVSVNLHFYDSVSISKFQISLGDVARIDAPQNIKNSLKSIIVGEAAPAGFSRFVSSETTVLYDVSSKYSNISFSRSGATRCKVNTNSQIMSLYEFENLIEEHIEKFVKWNKDNWSIELRNGEKKIRTLPQSYDVTVMGNIDKFARGSIRLTLNLVQEKKTIRVPIVCKLKVIVPVVKTSEMITRGEALKKETLYFERTDISSYRYMPFTNIDKVIGTVASRSISSGSIIHNLCVKNSPTIKKGDMVYIEVVSGSVKISLPARAREDGYKGETIWVENVKTHKVLRVKIKDSGKVSLMEGELI